MSEWSPDPLYQQISDELLIDPLPPERPPAAHDEFCDDHEVVVVNPGWFLPFDEVDSRTVRNVGAPL